MPVFAPRWPISGKNVAKSVQRRRWTAAHFTDFCRL